MNFNGKVAILISSHDGSETLWEALEKSYREYWPDNNLKIYLATNFKKPKLEFFNVLPIGEEMSWSDNILKCIDLIKEDFILLMYDDVFLHKKINNEIIKKYFKDIVENNWDYLRLHYSPKPDKKINERVGLIYPNRSYRLSTAMSIFKKTVFKDLLVASESPWEFEMKGGIRSNKYKNFYGSLNKDFPYLNAIVKGKWVPPVYHYLKKNNYPVNQNSIKLMSKSDYFMEQIKRFRFQLMLKIVPNSIMGYIRNILIKIKS
tara:strand:+ start:5383 stop:6165 length:783 start_codon:yes stop_codon:yes gene_type:complete